MNAAENPFRVSRIHALSFAWPTGVDAAALTQRWCSLGRCAALVAPHGHGKSTLLREWCGHLRAEGWNIYNLTLRDEQKRFPLPYAVPRSERAIAVLDGAEQLGPLGWRRWLFATRHAAGRIITQHRPGRLPTLLALQTNPPLLRHLLLQLLGNDLSQLPASPEDLFALHRGDLREIFRALYDHWA